MIFPRGEVVLRNLSTAYMDFLALLSTLKTGDFSGMIEIEFPKKALQIGNCCCLVHKPWTPEEIGTPQGLAGERINHCESMGWKKLGKVVVHI